MKKDIKSLIMKSLIVAVFLIIGNAVWAQHPLLSDDELNVYVLPNQQQITIGKQAYDEGRTCYKWNGYFSEDGVEERMGSLQVFSRPSYMVENSDFEFHLTVIGEQYYEQTVWVHVGYDNITLEVTPKIPCFSGYGVPQLWDYDIVTNPPGFENYVRIESMHPHTNVIDGSYDVTFVLDINGRIVDTKTILMTNTDEMGSMVFAVNYDLLKGFFSGLDKMLLAIEKGISLIPGPYSRTRHLGPDIEIGTWTVTNCYECCDYIVRQQLTDVDHFQIKGGLSLESGVNFWILRLGVRGSVEAAAGLGNIHSKMYRTCNYTDTEYSIFGSVEASARLFVEDGADGHFVELSGGLVDKFTFQAFRLRFTGTQYVESYGVLIADVYLEAKLKVVSLCELKCTLPLVHSDFDLKSRVRISN